MKQSTPAPEQKEAIRQLLLVKQIGDEMDCVGPGDEQTKSSLTGTFDRYG